jgi:hypothetical protein
VVQKLTTLLCITSLLLLLCELNKKVIAGIANIAMFAMLVIFEKMSLDFTILSGSLSCSISIIYNVNKKK